ncbi:MAG TPA: PEP-CTERM sorting domain-containing protein [Burkholderiaceae bacterium]
MNFVKSLFAAAALVAAVGAQAQTFSFGATPMIDFAAPTFSTSTPALAYVTSGSVANVNLQPMGSSGTYLAVATGGSATIDLGGATSFSFLWGSPDATNKITIDGVDFTGSGLLGATANSANSNTQWVTVTDLTGMSNFTITTNQIAFEMAVAAPVPEPETYALMLAGLAAMGFVARRRKNA